MPVENMVETSILVVNYKTPELLDRCVASVKQNTARSYELLVHDNSPPAANLGFAKANNVLLARAKGKYLVLLNPDTQVTQNWLDSLIETAESDSRIGIIQPKLLRPDGLIDSTGHAWRKWGVPFDRGAGEADHGQYDDDTELSSCCFACALIRKEVFEKIGLLDQRLFLFFEDVDFSLRAKQAGWRIIYCPKSIVYHSKHGSGISTAHFYMPYITLKLFGPKRYLKMVGYLIIGIPVGLKNSDWSYVRKKLGEIRDAFSI